MFNNGSDQVARAKYGMNTTFTAPTTYRKKTEEYVKRLKCLTANATINIIFKVTLFTREL